MTRPGRGVTVDPQVKPEVTSNPFANVSVADRVKYAGQVIAVGFAAKKVLAAAATAAELQEIMRRDFCDVKYARVALPK